MVHEIADSTRLPGLELSSSGGRGRPDPARRLWEWLRDDRAQGARPLDRWAAWVGRFLGLGDDDDPATLARWLAHGFSQGIAGVRAGVAMPRRLDVELPAGLAEAGIHPVAGLRWTPGTDLRLGFQSWAADWIGRKVEGASVKAPWRSAAPHFPAHSKAGGAGLSSPRRGPATTLRKGTS